MPINQLAKKAHLVTAKLAKCSLRCLSFGQIWHSLRCCGKICAIGVRFSKGLKIVLWTFAFAYLLKLICLLMLNWVLRPVCFLQFLIWGLPSLPNCVFCFGHFYFLKLDPKLPEHTQKWLIVKAKNIVLIFREIWIIKVVLDLYQHWKCHFLALPYGHFRRKCPSWDLQNFMTWNQEMLAHLEIFGLSWWWRTGKKRRRRKTFPKKRNTNQQKT